MGGLIETGAYLKSFIFEEIDINFPDFTPMTKIEQEINYMHYKYNANTKKSNFNDNSGKLRPTFNRNWLKHKTENNFRNVIYIGLMENKV